MAEMRGQAKPPRQSERPRLQETRAVTLGIGALRRVRKVEDMLGRLRLSGPSAPQRPPSPAESACRNGVRVLQCLFNGSRGVRTEDGGPAPGPLASIPTVARPRLYRTGWRALGSHSRPGDDGPALVPEPGLLRDGRYPGTGASFAARRDERWRGHKLIVRFDLAAGGEGQCARTGWGWGNVAVRRGIEPLFPG
jgi:hypothetical protein